MDPQNEIDKSNLLETIKKIPDQLVEGIDLAKEVTVKGDVRSIVLSGMGGSALVGELLRMYLDDQSKVKSQKHTLGNDRGSKVKVDINRTYNLPGESYDENCLNIISSYSGNTEETLSCFSEALANNLKCLGVASGGKVLEICKEQRIPYILMPKPYPTFQPRTAFGYSFSALLKLFFNLGLINNPEKKLKEASVKIKSDLAIFLNLGKDIAKKIQGKTPIIYAPNGLKYLAMIWKIMLNENAKTPAFWNYFPELNHNEMVGFTQPQGNFHPIMLRDKNDHPQNLKRIEKTEQILKENNIDSIIIEIPEGEMIYRIFSTLQIGCFASYYLALSYEIDPTPVEMVERFKKMLG